MSKQAYATIKDLAPEQKAKIAELVKRLGQETAEKQEQAKQYKALKDDFDRLQAKYSKDVVDKDEQINLLKAELKNSYKKMEKLASVLKPPAERQTQNNNAFAYKFEDEPAPVKTMTPTVTTSPVRLPPPPRTVEQLDPLPPIINTANSIQQTTIKTISKASNSSASDRELGLLQHHQNRENRNMANSGINDNSLRKSKKQQIEELKQQIKSLSKGIKSVSNLHDESASKSRLFITKQQQFSPSVNRSRYVENTLGKPDPDQPQSPSVQQNTPQLPGDSQSQESIIKDNNNAYRSNPLQISSFVEANHKNQTKQYRTERAPAKESLMIVKSSQEIIAPPTIKKQTDYNRLATGRFSGSRIGSKESFYSSDLLDLVNMMEH